MTPQGRDRIEISMPMPSPEVKKLRQLFEDELIKLGRANLSPARVDSMVRATPAERTSMLEVLGRDYVRTARAKGAREPRVIFRHGLRNALLPVATGLGLSLLATLSGSVAIELVFNRPGIGEVLISAIAKRDYPVIQGGVVVFAFFVVVVNLAVDLAYIAIDPRIRAKA